MFHSRLPKMALDGNFLAYYFTEKTTCIKGLCHKSFQIMLNYIMRNSTYTQEKVISASVKTLQIKIFPLSPTMLFTLRSVCMSRVAPLGNEVSTAIKNVPYRHQTIKFAVGAIMEPLQSLESQYSDWYFAFEKS